MSITDTETRAHWRDAITTILGFNPEDSLVLIPATLTGAAARIDLAPLLSGVDTDVYTRLAQSLVASGVSGVVVAYFTDRDPATLAQVDEQLSQALGDADIHRATTVLFDQPATGTLRSDLGQIAPAHPAAQARAARAYDAAKPDLAAYLRALDRVRAGRYIPAAMIGDAGKCLTNVHLRDAVVIHLTGLTLPPPERLAKEGLSDDVAGQALATILHPQRGSRPGDDAELHRSLLTSIVAYLAPDRGAPARTLLALIAWWGGDGALANRHLEEALTCDPTYRLAHLMAWTFANPTGQ